MDNECCSSRCISMCPCYGQNPFGAMIAGTGFRAKTHEMTADQVLHPCTSSRFVLHSVLWGTDLYSLCHLDFIGPWLSFDFCLKRPVQEIREWEEKVGYLFPDSLRLSVVWQQLHSPP